MKRSVHLLILLFSFVFSKAQTTYDFSVAPALSVPSGYPSSWKTIAEITVDGVQYVLNAGGNGTWTHMTGGNGNSLCLRKDGSGGDQLNIARKDGQPFQFYGIWLKHSSMYSPPFYQPPYYTINYYDVNDEPTSYVYSNSATSSTETYTNDITVNSVNIYFSSMMYFWIDDLKVGPAGSTVPELTATTSKTNVTCNGGSNGTASVSVATGVPPYTYSWSPSGGTGATATGLSAGTYTCTITDGELQQITKTFTITQPVATPISYTLQPSDKSAAQGTDVDFKVTATNATSYQWQVNHGSGFTNISNNTVYAGATTATLTVKSVTSGLNGYAYRCVSSNACVSNVSSNPAYLTILSNNANLSQLQISDESLQPEFSSGTLSYSAEVAAGTASVNITATKQESNATITINGQSATSGTPVSVSLNGGTNTITIVVTAQDGIASKTYTLSVYRSSISVLNIERKDAAISNASTRKYLVTFNGTVNGLNGGHFSVTGNGTLSEYYISNVSQITGSSYEVEVNTGTGSGSLQLNMVNGDELQVPLGNVPFYGESPYIIDRSKPVVMAKDITVKIGQDGKATISASQLDDGSLDNITAGSALEFSIDKTEFTGQNLGENIVTLTVMDEAGNSNSAIATVTVTKEIASIAAAQAVEITYGENLSLPETVGVVYVDGSTGSLSVNWNLQEYSGIATVYQIAGSVVLPEYILNPELLQASVGVTVAKRTLNVTLQGNVEKVYDGNTEANVSAEHFSTDAFSSSDISVHGTATYDDRNSGENKLVTVSSMYLKGEDAFNYALASEQVSANVGKITKRTLSVQLTGIAEKTYDGNTSAAVTNENFHTDKLEADNVTISGTAAYDTKQVGVEKNVTVTTLSISGDDALNYQLSAESVHEYIGVIKAKFITASLSPVPVISKVYDGSQTATLVSGNYVLTGVEENDDIAVTGDAKYSDAHAGSNKTIDVTNLILSGEDSYNYKLSNETADTKGSITQKELTVVLNNITPVTKVYDGNADILLDAGNYALEGVVEGDVITVTGKAAFSNKHAGTNKTVMANTFELSGDNVNDYILITETATVRGSITPKPITVAINAQPLITKTYDGNDEALLTAENYVIADAVEGDQLNITGKAFYHDRNVGIAKQVNVTDYVLAGDDAANYHLETVSSATTGDITPREIAVNLVHLPAITKIYDGNTEASIAAGNYEVTGILQDDEVVLNNPEAGAYDNAHAGDNKLVTVNGLVISGEQSANYILKSTEISANVGTILPREVVIKANDHTKVYGDADPALTYEVTGLVGEDKLTGSPSREKGADAGTYGIKAGTLSASGDYTISEFIPAVFTITPAALEIRAEDKTWKTGVMFTGFTYKYSGFRNGDDAGDLTVKPQGSTTFHDRSPMGTYELNVKGAVSKNYVITYQKGLLTVLPATDDKKSFVKIWRNSPTEISVRIYSDIDQKAYLKLYTDLGQPIIVEQKQLQKGVNTFTMRLSHNLSSSMYVLNVNAQTFNTGQQLPVK